MTSALRAADELFLAWRRMLGRGLRCAEALAFETGAAARTAPSTVLDRTSAALADVRSPDRPLPVSIASVALALATLGTSIGLYLGTLGDGSVIGSLLFAAETAAWALFRLIVLAMLASDSGRSLRLRSFAVWGIGLLPYTLGLTPSLRAIAFVGSAALTYRLLLRQADRTSARFAVAIAFGGQALAALAAWIVLNGLLFLVPVTL